MEGRDWKKCITVRVAFEISFVQDAAQCFIPLPVACKMEDSQLLLQYHVYLHAAMSHHDDNELNL